jgi:biopolymer transport protein ExbD
MAKREVEEINAGSMADIAFLLLIFFLITTTMNLPQVHEERLPQKSDVEFLLNERNVLQIMANKNDKIGMKENLLKWMIFKDQLRSFISIKKGRQICQIMWKSPEKYVKIHWNH